jgi:GDP-L-fucose synthase
MTINPTPAGFDLAGTRVWVAGHRGMVGSALARRLAREDCEILAVDRSALDLRRQAAVEDWIAATRPAAVFIAAATVGGIIANTMRPVDFLYDNLAIATNIIHAAAKHGVRKLMFLGAACMYPRLAPQPMSEDSLLEGLPEPTNQWYAVAKIAGVKLCEAYRRHRGCDFVSAVPANLYGPGDRFDAEAGHVVPGLMMRLYEAKVRRAVELPVWGTGQARREFMHVDDCADALVFLMKSYSEHGPINVGTGEEVSIAELAHKIAQTVGYTGRLVFDPSKPDGMPRKLLNSSRILGLGWRPSISLDHGLAQTFDWYRRTKLAQYAPAAADGRCS